MIIDDPLVEKDRKNPFVNCKNALKWLEFQLGKGEANGTPTKYSQFLPISAIEKLGIRT